MRIIPVEPGNRIQLPEEWTELLRIRGVVGLERVPQGFLIHLCPPATWDEVFATKLPIGRAPDDDPDLLNLTDEDLLF